MLAPNGRGILAPFLSGIMDERFMSSSSLQPRHGDNVISLGPRQDDPMLAADADLRHVLDRLAGLGGKPLEAVTPKQARRQPGLSEALAEVLKPAGRTLEPETDVTSSDAEMETPDGKLKLRVHRTGQDGESGRPLVLYLHGGGWVTAGNDRDETVPRLIARQTGAVVVAPAYRLAPEHKFPAAHEDAYAAWLWMIENAEALGGDAARAAVFGEDAGANMALNIALQARDEAMQAPVHSVLVTPIAGTDVTRPSHIENARARPLGTALLQWYFRHAFANKADAADPRIGLAQREDFAGINPVTLILADIDPVRSEGEALALKLNEADVWVDAKVYEGVSHDFFALGRVVNKARFAQAQALTNLNEALKASRRSPGLA
jgi:acetyl esterase/lipase